MTLNTPVSSRYTLQDRPEGPLIVIPSRRNWGTLLFVSVWLFAWAVGEMSALAGLAQALSKFGAEVESLGVALFLILWLALWTLSGGAALVTLLWSWGGREILDFNGDRFTLRYDYGLFSRAHAFEREEVHDFRATSMDDNPKRRLNTGWLSRGGHLAFTYRDKRGRCGSGLTVYEAEALASEIRNRHPED